MATLDPQTMQRLAFIRYLYSTALDQSRKPEPFSALSILSFHDSVELFLQLASEQLNVGRPKLDFLQYWDVIDPALAPNRLAQKESTRRLNNARIALKHHGTLPANLAIEQLGANTTSFFEENTALLFQVVFSEVSLIDLVLIDDVRDKLREAETVLAVDDHETAMVATAVAFAQLLDHVEDRYYARYRRSPFWFGDSFEFDKSFFRNRAFRHSEQDRFEDKLVETIEAMQRAMRILSLGLDYSKYTKFRLLTPAVRRMAIGQYRSHIGPGLQKSGGWPPSYESCQFCLNYVVECAVQLQQKELIDV